MPDYISMTALIILVVTLLLAAGMLYLISKLLRFQAHLLVIIILGVILGLIIGALLSIPLSRLPAPYSQWLPVIVTLFVTIAFATAFARRQHGFLSFLQSLPVQLLSVSGLRGLQKSGGERQILVDTSVIIDGRLYQIAKTGFLPGQLLVPRFVLGELQTLADSEDALKRERGRRGLDILADLRKEFDLEVISEDVPNVPEVDSKLVQLSKRLGTGLMTTDYNLGRVAQVEGIAVLNLNELSGALRAAVLPGEVIEVEIVQPGKEKRQGVGYFPDGTMIVVEGGDKLIGQRVPVTVTRSLQTVAGKMIFAQPAKPVQKPPRAQKTRSKVA